MSNILKKLFSILGNDENKPDFQTCCTPMEVFDKQKVKAIVKQWLLFIAEYETLPNDIIALNFNLWEAVEENGQSCYTLELTGSKQYDAENDDWACEEDFDPRERNCDALQLSSEIPWEEVLNGLVEVLRVKKRTESNKSFSGETYNSWVCGRRSDSYKIETFRNVL